MIAKLDFDPYEPSFRYVAAHILAKDLTEASVRDALMRGHAYVSHDWLCDASGFNFAEREGARVLAGMGGETRHTGNLELIGNLPVECSLKLIGNGAVLVTTFSDRLECHPSGPGVYRIEAWLTVDGESRPWVYSNPIQVR